MNELLYLKRRLNEPFIPSLFLSGKTNVIVFYFYWVVISIIQCSPAIIRY